MPLSIPTLSSPSPALPASLGGLDALAKNLYWSWHPAAAKVFATLSPELWASKASPIEILRRTDLSRAAANPALVSDVQAALADFNKYLSVQIKTGGTIAYFCAEYGLHESSNLYSGGLGILAGDHCKEASDLALPFVAVGLFYHFGFFHQMVDWEGRQEHLYPLMTPENSPLDRVCERGTQTPLTIYLDLPGRKVAAAVWRLAVGRVSILLLDTNVPENTPEDRAITGQLYTSGREMRFYQEIVLGIGGVRVLRALGIEPSVWHMNEGHSALLLVERLREGEAVAKDSVITIHTPVPEGNERFDAKLVQELLAPTLAGSKLKIANLLKKGLGADHDPNVFDMTAFALRHSRAANGVSLLHGETADATWREIAGYPVQGITNGVHMPTWLGPEIAALSASPKVDEGEDRPDWLGAFSIPDRDLWAAHQAQKQALIEFARAKIFRQQERHGVGPDGLRAIASQLDPDAFLIGFARRFATYKRASLIFNNEARLAKLLKQNVQIIFAGKAHPGDRGGQQLIAEVYEKTQSPRFRGRVFLLEDYDMEIGRYLVQGVDLWLNNPRRPLEASGTSGMKAAANGVPNLSILDGWWDEAYRDGAHQNGYRIGGRKTLPNSATQDKKDAAELLTILESEVVPRYFDRNREGLPEAWIQLMKESIASSIYSFSTTRMLRDYLKHLY